MISDPNGLSRREFLATSAAASAVATAAFSSASSAFALQPATPTDAVPLTVTAKWIEGTPPATTPGTTFTIPWPRGTVPGNATFSVQAQTPAGQQPVPAQSWPLAYWPDGSAKWTAFATTPGQTPPDSYRVSVGSPAEFSSKITLAEHADAVEINTGPLQCTLSRTGEHLIKSITRAGRATLTSARLVAHFQNSPDAAPTESFTSAIDSLTVEQSGPLRAVVKITGTHKSPSRSLLPFSVRLYFYAGSDQIRLVHSFIYDCDETKDFLSGLGLRFSVPMTDAPHDRHIRFGGVGAGLFGEAIRGITGLRRDPGEAARNQQVAGLRVADIAERVSRNLQYVPTWGDYTLSQLSADGFQIRKRTKPGHAWIPAAAGTRASGTGYIGGASGGVAFGLRDFWQRHPTQLDIRQAHTDTAEVTLWMYSPEAPPMDLRFFHDGLGQDTYAKQNAGLDITYEDYEPGYGTPNGIARSSELFLHIAAATPAREAQAHFATLVQRPPQLLCDPAHYLATHVFGGIWTLPDSSTPVKAAIDTMLTQVMDQYILEVDQRHWYGFWDYGDVMHSYDTDRHVWKYDIGGFAWDNSELSPDLFFWYMVLRTARADFFRFAEAHVRHSGEVDVYHSGRFKGLGTRHNVQHWGCSSKQTRISTAIYRRHFYFLTADERTGDLVRAQLDQCETEKKISVGRKIGATPETPSLPLPPLENTAPPGGLHGVGAMGWGNILAAWLTEAERTNDPTLHAKIRLSLLTISKLPKGLYSAGWKLNLDTGEIVHDGDTGAGVSHLTACFGLPEISAELVYTYPEEGREYAKTWAHYGIIWNGTAAERTAALGPGLRGFSLNDSHSRATAFAAWLNKDQNLAARAWREYFGSPTPSAKQLAPRPPTPLTGPDVLNPIQEIPLGTNGAQFWLASLQNLHYIGNSCPKDLTD